MKGRMNWKTLLVKRRGDTHKYNYGHTLIIGASKGLSGAICLASLSALRIGAGLVTVGIPSELNNIFEIKLTEIMTLPLKSFRGILKSEAFKEMKEFILRKKVNVVGIGPGLGNTSSTQKLVERVIKELELPLILDADAINSISLRPEMLKESKARVILTPHLGEFSRLIKKPLDFIKNNRKKLAKEFSLRYNLTLVLKGYKTLVVDKGRIYENKSGNPGMATAGSGDVLLGIICGLISQIKNLSYKEANLFEAVKLGVYLHGLAGDLAVEEKTQASLIASDIIEYLPLAIKEAITNKLFNQ